tara:strand:- start:15985 stop:16161 length:177 start_codon:yes stop_codon:yes gene_type:complete
METLITVLMTLSVALNIVVFGIFGIAYKQWKKGQKAKGMPMGMDLDAMLRDWPNNKKD